MRAITMSLLGFVFAIATAKAGLAHDQWANGDPVPAWVKAACCGPEDVHHLTPTQVHLSQGAWVVDGYPEPIPVGTELPSPDGEYWIFYRTLPNGDKTRVYCFFTPYQGT